MPRSESGVIQVDRLCKRYGDFTAVDDLSFGTGAGAVMGLVGPNGAGKTTTLRCVAGHERVLGE
ncbi:MAG: ATP-binding cassette domain-containing protein, partial [Pseudoxanthomonas sp.]|nr:ATP-binding cassette domain-containing protein [Pseudoxanthomonas sp.]